MIAIRYSEPRRIGPGKDYELRLVTPEDFEGGSWEREQLVLLFREHGFKLFGHWVMTDEAWKSALERLGF